jgi:hypothetical protein
MLGYGFAIADNPFDHYAVGFRVPPGSPLEEARQWRVVQSSKANKKGKTDDSYRYYVFNAEHPRAKTANCLETSIFSPDLFDSISILSANFRELQSDRFRSTCAVLKINPDGSTDRRCYRNLLHTLSQLRMECSSRSEILRGTALNFNDGSILAMSLKQQYAKTYRDSQLAILETAALLCRYCLLRAQKSPMEDSVLLFSASAAEHIPQTSKVMGNVKKLVHKKHSAAASRTLFSFSAAIELLPENLAGKIRDAAEGLSKALTVKTHTSFSQPLAVYNEMSEKIKFTVLLSALREVRTKRSKMLPHVLHEWMKDLQAWYPFDDPFWNGPTDDFLPTLEALMKVTDRTSRNNDELVMKDLWYDPQMICWGWNVQEEEGLFADTETLLPRGGGGSAVCQPSKYLLCISGGRESNGSFD